eukprot:TRINITY_DN22128_c0_g1_i1.p1 TRINITY_DN22128_c0_g1~~TRINITY_DN22128_c0_g1_i1.p1  ORF type:complete len:406 (-),score=44.38 TRINITY_DN22128_c0_g1_i1:827-2044(-)
MAALRRSCLKAASLFRPALSSFVPVCSAHVSLQIACSNGSATETRHSRNSERSPARLNLWCSHQISHIDLKTDERKISNSSSLHHNSLCQQNTCDRNSFASFSNSQSPNSAFRGSRTAKASANNEVGSPDLGESSLQSWIDSRSFSTIRVELLNEGKVGLVTLARPKALNALSELTMKEVVEAFNAMDEDKIVGAIVITGEGKAFAAGADIKEMLDEKSFSSAYAKRLWGGWDAVMSLKKPIIAAVNGYALGGGCELALMCDCVLVSSAAQFGQPEVNLGVIPGMGGTQRLVRAVGKARAMEMVLSGAHFMGAEEAVFRGVASRVVEGGAEELVAEAVALASKMAALSKPAVAMAKAAVNAAYEGGLRAGLEREKDLFYAAFSLEDQKEGMAAFVEKRKPAFKDQ